ncbi:MAG: hypothetical protein ACO1NQ_02370 [Flavobacteriales bacterium]
MSVLLGPFLRILTAVHGLYYTVVGSWPLVHFSSFEAVTGQKCDDWLVRTVAGIMVFFGIALLQRTFAGRMPDAGLRQMAIGISGVLAVVAVSTAIGGRNSAVYLFEGIVHTILFTGWILVWAEHRLRPPVPMD